MTHAEYLEAFHELWTRVIPEVSLSIAKGETDYAKTLMDAAVAQADVLWARRVETASREVPA